MNEIHKNINNLEKTLKASENPAEVYQRMANQIKPSMVGKVFKHFKGGLYKVVNIAIESENYNMTVIYQSLDDESKIWARPYRMFMSEVDHAKYPKAEQKWRFEEVGDTNESN